MDSELARQELAIAVLACDLLVIYGFAILALNNWVRRENNVKREKVSRGSYAARSCLLIHVNR